MAYKSQYELYRSLLHLHLHSHSLNSNYRPSNTRQNTLHKFIYHSISNVIREFFFFFVSVWKHKNMKKENKQNDTSNIANNNIGN